MKLPLLVFIVLTVLSTLSSGKIKRTSLIDSGKLLPAIRVDDRLFASIDCPGGGVKTKSGRCLPPTTPDPLIDYVIWE